MAKGKREKRIREIISSFESSRQDARIEFSDYMIELILKFENGLLDSDDFFDNVVRKYSDSIYCLPSNPQNRGNALAVAMELGAYKAAIRMVNLEVSTQNTFHYHLPKLQLGAAEYLELVPEETDDAKIRLQQTLARVISYRESGDFLELEKLQRDIRTQEVEALITKYESFGFENPIDFDNEIKSYVNDLFNLKGGKDATGNVLAKACDMDAFMSAIRIAKMQNVSHTNNFHYNLPACDLDTLEWLDMVGEHRNLSTQNSINYLKMTIMRKMSDNMIIVENSINCSLSK